MNAADVIALLPLLTIATTAVVVMIAIAIRRSPATDHDPVAFRRLLPPLHGDPPHCGRLCISVRLRLSKAPSGARGRVLSSRAAGNDRGDGARRQSTLHFLVPRTRVAQRRTV